MNKTIHDIDMRKLIRVAAAASDDRKEIKDGDQLRNQIVQIDDEIATICEGLTLEDQALVFHKVFEQIEQFNRDPSMKELFR